jgi:WD40 repeat protein
MSVNVFFCYAHEDEPLLKRLKQYLTPMQRLGLIALWHDRDISAGTAWEQEISEKLNTAQIILLLVSPDFMASDYCYGIEMKRALARHHRKEARVIPVILRPIDWQDILGNIQALPTDAKPVTSSLWPSPDDAFYDVAKGIRKVVMQLTPTPAFASPAVPGEIQQEVATPGGITPAVQLGDTVSPLLSPLAIEKLVLFDTITGHSYGVYCVVISADGRTLASCGDWDKTIKVWNLATGKEVRTLTGHTDHVNCVAISADGQTLVSGSADKTIKVWGILGHKRVDTSWL